MKKNLTILFLLISYFVIAQPVVYRAGPANTTIDYRSGAKYNFYLPQFADTTAANALIGIDSSAATIYTYNDKSYWFRTHAPKAWVKITNQQDINNIFGCYSLLRGGEVTWDSLLVFSVNDANYIINCNPYQSRDTSLTLSAADPSNPRIDVIAVDTLGRAVIVEGTPAADPAKPQVDPSSQLELTNILVGAGATIPSGVSREMIYDENLGTPSEWAGSVAGGSFSASNFDNTTFPYTGVKSASITAVTQSVGPYVQFAYTSTKVKTDYAVFSFAIRLKANLINTATITVSLYNGTTLISNAVNIANYGFSRTNSTGYQFISIPISAFTGSNPNFDRIRFNLNRSGSGFYLDRVQLVGGIVQNITNSNAVTNVFRRVGTDSVFQVINGTAVFAFRDSTGSGGSGLLTADNGLTANTATNVQLGGTLNQNTVIDNNSYFFKLINANNHGLVVDNTPSAETSYLGRQDVVYSYHNFGDVLNTYGIWGSANFGYYYDYNNRRIKLGDFGLGNNKSYIFINDDSSLTRINNPIYWNNPNSGAGTKAVRWDATSKQLVIADTTTGGSTTSSTKLANIGTGVDVGVDSTNRVKRLAGPQSVKIDSTTTANTVTFKLDGDAASPGNNVFYGTNSSGTKGFYNPTGVASVQKGSYAQRVALVSPDTGAIFYQTDELEGLYTWTGGDWAYQPPAGWSASIQDFLTSQTGWPSYGLSQNVGGSGAANNILNRINKAEGAYGIDSCSIGTSSSGAVGITYQPNSGPNDSAYGVSYIAYYRLQFDTLSNATNSYRGIWGTTGTLFNSTSSVGNAIFRYDSVALGDKWQWELRNAGGTTRINTGITVQANTWYTLCINYDQPTRTFKAYINGTLVDSRAFVMTTSAYQNAWQVTKSAGTVTRCIKLDKMYTLIKNY